MRNVHHAITCWLLAGCCGSANADSQATVTLREAKAADGGPGEIRPTSDDKAKVADASTVTPENCKAVCNVAQSNHSAVKDCNPVDGGEGTTARELASMPARCSAALRKTLPQCLHWM